MLMRMWRMGNTGALLVGMQIGAATVGNSMEIPRKIKNGTALWPRNSTSGNISEETQNTSSKGYMHHYVYCSIIYSSRGLEVAQASISKWGDKKAVVHLPSGILLGHKKKDILPFATARMDLENIMLSAIGQSEKDKCHMISLVCVL